MNPLDPPAESALAYRVRVTKDHLVFSAGHFITYNGGICEPVHGHNWRAGVEVGGPLGSDHYVFDFIALLDLAGAICKSWDHKMLLPDGSGLIALRDEGANWRVEFAERYWSFPKAECVVLAVPNTTAELIGREFGRRLLKAIEARGLERPKWLEVEIEENFGQSAFVRFGAERG